MVEDILDQSHGPQDQEIANNLKSIIRTNIQDSGRLEPTYTEDATEEQIQTLRHIAEDIPVTVWLVAFTGAAQCFAYFGVTVPWQNYIQNPSGNLLLPGALGLGQSAATIINNAFLFFGYLTPTLLAVVSDAWLGRFRTLVLSLGLFFIGCAILFGTSLPAAHATPNLGLAGLVIAFVFMGLGQGGVRAVVHPFLGDQLPTRKPQVVQTKSGELVVTDRAMAIQYMFNAYYWMINIAGLSLIATTSLEKNIGFWAAYLLPLCVLVVGMILLLVWNRKLIKPPPQGNILPNATRACLLAIRAHFNLSAASPSHQRIFHARQVPWSEKFISEIRQALNASKVMFSFTIFWLCYNQVGNNLVSQAGQMNTGPISNDTIQALNPITCIILGPMIQNILFTTLARHRISFGPIARMTTAFLFMSLGIGYAAVVQKVIYTHGPCYDHPLTCPAANNNTSTLTPNNVSVVLQIPLYIFIGVGEILGLVTLSEFSYAQAPKSMKALLQAIGFIAAALGSALGVALGPVSRDPWLVVTYACIAGVTAMSAGLFWAVFRRADADAMASGVDDGDREADAETERANEKGRNESNVSAKTAVEVENVRKKLSV